MLRWNKLFIGSLCLIVTSCAFLENRTFVDEMEHDTDGMFVPNEDFSVVPGDSGEAYRNTEQVWQRTPASYKERLSGIQDDSIQKELAMRERQLSHPEYLRYREYSPYLESDSEKIYYLKLTTAERDDYLRSRGLIDQNSRYDSANQPQQASYSLRETLFDDYGRDTQEVFLGMDKTAVMRTMGKPHRVDIAGDPKFQNERWAFVSNGKVKYIYFEAGQVQGWANE